VARGAVDVICVGVEAGVPEHFRSILEAQREREIGPDLEVSRAAGALAIARRQARDEAERRGPGRALEHPVLGAQEDVPQAE
jgi:hypothetical protein